MDWSKVVSMVSQAAPFLGSLIGGKAGEMVGGLAGSGIKLVAAALGVEPTQDAVAQAIATDPAAAEKLREFELNNKLELQKLTVQTLGMELADVADARKRQSDHEKATGKSDINLYVLSWVIVFGFLAVITIMLFVDIPPDQTNVLFALLGTLGAGFMLVLQYFYGTNKSSESKTAMIFNSTPNVPKKEG
jgi:hypothetical protein